MIYLLLYIDDMLVAMKSKVDVARLKKMLNLEFDMKDLGAAWKISSMEIYCDRARGKLFLTQIVTSKRFSCFGMEKSKLISTPTTMSYKLSLSMSPQTEEEVSYMSRIPYANAIGCLM